MRMFHTLVAVLLALVALMLLAVPVLSIAEISIHPPDTPAETVALEPAVADGQSVTGFTTGADPPRAVIDLTALLQAVLSLAVSLITAFLIPWIKAKYSTEQRQRIAAVYQTIVYAAEQMFGAGTGEQKLQWATEQLAAKGITVDRTVLEAEVRKMTTFSELMLEPPDGATTAGI